MATPQPGLREETFFHVPETLKPFVEQREQIAFYAPKAGHVLRSDNVFAVRCNENYNDVKACLEGERAYIRNAAFRADHIVFYRAYGKQPILIIGCFDDAAIRNCGRSMDSAVDRSITVRPQKINRIEMPGVDAFVEEPWRVIGSVTAVDNLLAGAPASWRASVKLHHVEGFKVAQSSFAAKIKSSHNGLQG